MKIVFFGTPDYVLPILDKVHKTFKERSAETGVVTVVTQKPRPVGRDQKITYSAVDTWAYKKDIPVIYEPEELLSGQIKGLGLGIIADYGKIISKRVIDSFPRGILNIHFSLLPSFRGASPVQAAIVNGDKEIGITIFKIDEELDHGPIVSQFKEPISPQETYGVLKRRLFPIATEVLIELLPPYISGKIKLRPQEHARATYTRLITKKDGFIPPKYISRVLQGKVPSDEKWRIGFIKTKTLQAPPIKDFSVTPMAENLYNFVKAMDPWPGAWTVVKLKVSNRARAQKSQESKVMRLKILKAHLDEDKLILDEVQLEGKSPVSWEQFQNGYPNAALE